MVTIEDEPEHSEGTDRAPVACSVDDIDGGLSRGRSAVAAGDAATAAYLLDVAPQDIASVDGGKSTPGYRDLASKSRGIVTRIGLVGCVKSKQKRAAAAADLYTSPLFRSRRRYVETTCESWYILSAKHGLVSPTLRVEPYDQTLKTASRAQRRMWSERVVSDLRKLHGSFEGIVFEIHAGNEYRAFGLVEGLLAGGGRVEVPTDKLSLGRQLAFYNEFTRVHDAR
jgi:hypothetical protein